MMSSAICSSSAGLRCSNISLSNSTAVIVIIFGSQINQIKQITMNTLFVHKLNELNESKGFCVKINLNKHCYCLLSVPDYVFVV